MPGSAQALEVCGPYSFHVEQTFSEAHLSSRTISRETDSLRILRRGRAARKLAASPKGLKTRFHVKQFRWGFFDVAQRLKTRRIAQGIKNSVFT
jgi:hypothetical protein